jgi:hypothetical protein
MWRGRYRQVDAKAPELKEPHRPKKRYTNEKDITLKDRGTSNTYAIAKLRKHAPDIHARVLAGELSPHAGMIEAGFRKKPPSRKQTTLDKIWKLIATLSVDDLRTLVADLNLTPDEKAAAAAFEREVAA